jgi:hypothetical protein
MVLVFPGKFKTMDVDTSNLDSLEGFFDGTYYLPDDLTGWDTSNVTSMQHMFTGVGLNFPVYINYIKVFRYGLPFRESIVFGPTEQQPYQMHPEGNPDVSTWDTRKVKNMASMFEYRTEANPDVSAWKVPNLEIADTMFRETSVANPYFQQWRPYKLKRITGMFYNAHGIETLDLRSFGTAKQSISAYYAFVGMKNLKLLILPGNLENASVGEIGAKKYYVNYFDGEVHTVSGDEITTLADNTPAIVYTDAAIEEGLIDNLVTVRFEVPEEYKTQPSMQIMEKDAKVIEPELPEWPDPEEKHLYSVVDYWVDQFTGEKWDFSKPVGQNRILKPVWKQMERLYLITIDDGAGNIVNGYYKKGDEISVRAKTPDDKSFDRWLCIWDSGFVDDRTGDFEERYNPRTTYTVQNYNAKLAPRFKDKVYKLVVHGGVYYEENSPYITEEFKEGEEVVIDVFELQRHRFTKWVGLQNMSKLEGFDPAYNQKQKIKMPPHDVAMYALYTLGTIEFEGVPDLEITLYSISHPDGKAEAGDQVVVNYNGTIPEGKTFGMEVNGVWYPTGNFVMPNEETVTVKPALKDINNEKHNVTVDFDNGGDTTAYYELLGLAPQGSMSPDNRIYSNKEGAEPGSGKEYGNRNLQDTLFYNNDAFYIKEYTLNGAKDLPGLTMPYEDLAIKIVLAPKQKITVIGGRLDSLVIEGNVHETLLTPGQHYLSALDPAVGMEFAGWNVLQGNVTLNDPESDATFFVMPDEEVKIEAQWKPRDGNKKMVKIAFKAGETPIYETGPIELYEKQNYTDQDLSRIGSLPELYVPVTPNRETRIDAQTDTITVPVQDAPQEVSYQLTVRDGDKISVTQKKEGDEVFLLADGERPFIKWEGTVAPDKPEERNSHFIMPAKDVEMSAKYQGGYQIRFEGVPADVGAYLSKTWAEAGEEVLLILDPNTLGSRTFLQWTTTPSITFAHGELTAGFTMPESDVVVKIRFSGGTQPPVILTDPEEPNDPVEPGGTTGITTERIYGDNRIDTAIALSKANFTKADTVVIARADDYPDALTASVLAKAVNGPILLSYPDRVNDKVLAEISRLGARNLLLIGGEEAMHASTAQAYAKGRNTERIGGKNRYDTAGLIADTITQRTGKKTQAMIATGENFPTP